MHNFDPAYEIAAHLVAAMERGDEADEQRLRQALATTRATSESGRMAQAIEARELAAEVLMALAPGIVEAGLREKALALMGLLDRLVGGEAPPPQLRLASRDGRFV